MRHNSISETRPGFAEIIEKPLLYLVTPARGEEEATEAARIVRFTAYGRVITGLAKGSMWTAHCMNRDFEIQTDDSKWEQIFKDRLRDDPATVLVVPAEIVEQIAGIKPDTGSVIGVFERNNKLIFEQFN